jgi:hypothetical protein
MIRALLANHFAQPKQSPRRIRAEIAGQRLCAPALHAHALHDRTVDALDDVLDPDRDGNASAIGGKTDFVRRARCDEKHEQRHSDGDRRGEQDQRCREMPAHVIAPARPD